MFPLQETNAWGGRNQQAASYTLGISRHISGRFY